MFPLWLTVLASLSWCSWRWSRRLFPSDSPFLSLSSTLVLAWGALTATTMVLGIAGLLHPWIMFGSLALIVVLACMAEQAIPKVHGAPNEAPIPLSRTPTPWLIVWALVLAFWIGHVVIDGLLEFPSDWDSLNYHIPMVVQWLHARSLYSPDCFHWSNPGNNELIGLWFVAPFSGDFFIGLNNLPATVLLAAAAVELGRTLGLRPHFAHLAALVVVSNFVVLNQLVNQENDVAAAALFLAAILFGFRFAEGEMKADLTLFSISVGLLAGVKFYALGYAGLVGIAVLGTVLAKRGWSAGWKVLQAGVVGFTLFAGYWYLRNWLMAGSPLFPKGFTEETDVLTYLYPDYSRTSFLGNGRPEIWPLGLHALWMMAGPWHVAAVLSLPLLFTWFMVKGWRGLREKPGEPPNGQPITLAALLAGAALLLLSTPFAIEDQPGTLNQLRWHYCPVRYGLCFLSLAVLALALFLQDISDSLKGVWAARKILFLVLFLGAGVQFCFPRKDIPVLWGDTLFLAFNLFLFGVLLFLLDVRTWIAMKWGRALAAGLLAAGGGWGCSLQSQRWHQGFSSYYQVKNLGGPHLFGESIPEGSRVCVLSSRPYPFFGPRREYPLCQPVYLPSSRFLDQYLREKKARAVLANETLPYAFRIFEHWPELREEEPERFLLLKKVPPYVLFRIED